MLVLTRKPGEEVVIGSQIQVKVVAIYVNRVRLGITAPEDTPILRAELGHRPDSPGGPGFAAAKPTASFPGAGESPRPA